MNIKKVLILGSGALKIGEAGEFDYSGSQAIKALKEEGIQTILINPNIATVQTSKDLADEVYFLPVKDFFVEKVIQKEKPQGIFLSFGGQTALNCGLSLHRKGILKKYGVTILGNPIEAVDTSEDRKKFAEHLASLSIKTPQSKAAHTTKDALSIAEEIGYPVMIRSGFSLGGQGSGIAKNKTELTKMCEKAFSFVSQILVEQYLHHFKEIEYEVVRDKYDNTITVCNMENMDPLGIHTGESIVVAPSQTLTNFEYHFLREKAIQIVKSLKIVGECNVQFALNPNPQIQKHKNNKNTDSEHLIDYYVIEMNARLSRSSALASKATGYPLAYVAAKLALGKSLTSLPNKVTRVTQSAFEPALDYIVVKIPRWDIEKFKGAEETIGSSMKSVGEVMGIGRTFEEAYQKAIRMLDLGFEGATSRVLLRNGKSTKELVSTPSPKRMFALAEALIKGMSIEELNTITGIDPWFLQRIQTICNAEKNIPHSLDTLSKEQLLTLKQLGFSDNKIAKRTNSSSSQVRDKRKQWGIVPSVFQIDTLGGEFPAQTNYLYLTYNGAHHDVAAYQKDGVIVIGSGPYRIGSSVEFDWSSVQTVQSLKTHNKQSIIINCNPETVSTDFDVSSRLYFEELSFERIADIYDFENPYGIILSVGGQTPNNRAAQLKAYHATILGTDPADIDRAENRSTFSALLDTLSIQQPPWDTFQDLSGAMAFCEKVGFPVLIRPSYVLSGTLMRICHNKKELEMFMEDSIIISKDYPITVSKFIEDAKEIELDAVAQNGEIKASVISEHVENAGVHSGDASIVLPPQKLYVETQRKIEEIARKLAKSLAISGPFNIQFLAKENQIQVIEVNLRAARTIPFISKVTGIDFIGMAVDIFFAQKSQKQIPAIVNSLKNVHFVAVKVAQFSFSRLTGADPVLHVEMASTGEVACFGDDFEEAFLKGELAVGNHIPEKGIFISLGGEENKIKFLEYARMASSLNLPLYATEGTHLFLKHHGISSTMLFKIHEQKSPNVFDFFKDKKIDLAINLLEKHTLQEDKDHYSIRRAAIDYNIPLYTNRQKAEAFIKALCTKQISQLPIKSWKEYAHY